MKPVKCRELAKALTTIILSTVFVLLPNMVAAVVVVKPEVPLAVGDEYDQPSGSVSCNRTLTAEVVSIDQVIFFNRLDVFLPPGNILFKSVFRDFKGICLPLDQGMREFNGVCDFETRGRG